LIKGRTTSLARDLFPERLFSTAVAFHSAFLDFKKLFQYGNTTRWKDAVKVASQQRNQGIKDAGILAARALAL